MTDLNKQIDKAQSEAAEIKTQGVGQYIETRKVKMSIKQLLVTLGSVLLVGFILGAIVF